MFQRVLLSELARLSPTIHSGELCKKTVSHRKKQFKGYSLSSICGFIVGTCAACFCLDLTANSRICLRHYFVHCRQKLSQTTQIKKIAQITNRPPQGTVCLFIAQQSARHSCANGNSISTINILSSVRITKSPLYLSHITRILLQP